ncbi:MAG: hypothetical protein WD602_03380 [Actinomycetota bacterium]
MSTTGPAGVLYWYLVVFLLAFGLLAIASIGLPFLILGATLGLLSPSRARPKLFWPALTAVAGFLLGFALVAPLSCRTSEAAGIPPGMAPSELPTTCTSAVGIKYSGAGSHTPPVWPAVAVGLGAAAPGWAVGRIAARSGARNAPA